MEKRNVLYVEDMKECYENTQKALGNGYKLDWKRTPLDAIFAITGDISKYYAAIFDVNLLYNPSKPDNEQTKEGLDLMRMLKEKAKAKGINLPILCVSSENNKEAALENGANKFIWKEEFWGGKGKQTLDQFLKNE